MARSTSDRPTTTAPRAAAPPPPPPPTTPPPPLHHPPAHPAPARARDPQALTLQRPARRLGGDHRAQAGHVAHIAGEIADTVGAVRHPRLHNAQLRLAYML